MKTADIQQKKLRRRAGMLYRLRKKGVRCHTRTRTIFLPAGGDVESVCQIGTLRREFDFVVQFEI